MLFVYLEVRKTLVAVRSIVLFTQKASHPRRQLL